MTDETNAAETEDAEEATEEKPGSRGLSGKKLVMIVAPIVLLIGGGAGVYFSGLLDSLMGGSEPPVEQAEEGALPKPPAYYDLPEMLVNLNSANRGATFLKLAVSLEIASEADRSKLESVLPRIIDNFQVYLRELRIEDLSGSAGMQRLREELLLRVNTQTGAGVVTDVLFKEMLIQ